MPVSRELARASRVAEVADFPVRYRDLTQAGFDRLVPGDGINVKVWERGGLGVFAADPPASATWASRSWIATAMSPSHPGKIPGRRHDAGAAARRHRGAPEPAGRGRRCQRDPRRRRARPDGDGAGQPDQARHVSDHADRPAPEQRAGAGGAGATNPEQLVISLRRDNQVASVRLSDITATRTTTSCCARATSSPPMNRASS